MKRLTELMTIGEEMSIEDAQEMFTLGAAVENWEDKQEVERTKDS